jgi:hypothetical protein
MFTKGFLAGVKQKALRRKLWYSHLDEIERGILSLAAKIIENVKSDLLNSQILQIIVKLREASKSPFVKQVELYGRVRAEAIRKQGLSFGYKGSCKILGDRNFIRYLLFLNYYQPPQWRIILWSVNNG